MWIGPASRTLSGPGEGWGRGGASWRAALNPLKPQGPSRPEQPAAIRCDCKLGRCFGQPVKSPCCNPGAPTPAAGEAKASPCLTRCWAASTPYGLWHGTCSRPGRPPAQPAPGPLRGVSCTCLSPRVPPSRAGAPRGDLTADPSSAGLVAAGVRRQLLVQAPCQPSSQIGRAHV